MKTTLLPSSLYIVMLNSEIWVGGGTSYRLQSHSVTNCLLSEAGWQLTTMCFQRNKVEQRASCGRPYRYPLQEGLGAEQVEKGRDE